LIGILCSLTNEFADFDDFCSDYITDSTELKIQVENAEYILINQPGIFERVKTSKLLDEYKAAAFSTEFYERKSLFSFWKDISKPVLAFANDGIEYKEHKYHWSQILDSQIKIVRRRYESDYILQLVISRDKLVNIMVGIDWRIPFSKAGFLSKSPELIGASLEYHRLAYWERIKRSIT